MGISSALQIFALVVAVGGWVLKKLRDRSKRERQALRGEPEFQRNYEPIEVFDRSSQKRARPSIRDIS